MRSASSSSRSSRDARSYDAKTIGDLKQLHDTGTVTTPSSIVRDLDPAIERVILRCLSKDPAQRPASALTIAAALPGGDPLAAALAAGETPSPDMLAAAGETDAISVGRGVAAVAFVVLAAVAIAALSPRVSIAGRVPLDKPPAVLADRAQQILRSRSWWSATVCWSRLSRSRWADLLEDIPLTLSLSHWTATTSNLALATALALTFFGFYAARAGQPLFRKDLS